jgi:hypothetical protein
VKRLTAVVVLLLAACRGAPSGLMTGASSPEAAVTAFIGAAKAQDLQAMASVWGTNKGSVRETLSRAEIERRELILIRLLCQDEFRIVRKEPGLDGQQFVHVELMRRGGTLARRFTTVTGPGDRWYVYDFPVDDVIQQFCR